MPWSWKLARIAGIDVHVHATFFLLLAWVGFRLWSEGRTLVAVAGGVAFIVVLFACVVLHEFGHALTARRFGIHTRDITLLPIGGLARLERMPEDPRQELWIAGAGPAVNVAIAALLAVALSLTGGMAPLDTLTLLDGPFLERLLLVNVTLAVFNLLPAFPMDGGRVLRAALATRLSYARATRMATSLGQAAAMFFGLLGLLGGNPVLVFIALFVWVGAAAEAGMVQMRTSLAGVTMRQLMLTDFRPLGPHATLQDAVDLMLAGSQQDFPVVWGGGVKGILSRAALIDALGRLDRSTPVVEVMQREFPTVDADDPIEPVLMRLQAGQASVLPVTARGELVGLVTAENIGEFLMVAAAEQRRQGVRPRATPRSDPGA